MFRPFRINACELKNKVEAGSLEPGSQFHARVRRAKGRVRPIAVAAIGVALMLIGATAASAQSPERAAPATAPHQAAAGTPDQAPAPGTAPSPQHQAPAPGTRHEQPSTGEDHAEGESHGMFSGLLWPTVNFVILAGGLWWFFKDPVATYMRDRHTSIRQDLVEAASVKSAAAAQLAEIDRKLQALPGEIDALKKRGVEEIAAEEQRIAAQAAAERDRLLEQTRREIDVQLRLAKRDLVEHAANLSVQLASDRLKQHMTAEDQQRLVDRYVEQVSPRQA
jgi:F-type H+-transporting ATPase subunit b